MTTIAIIPARSGSKRLPNKNFKDFRNGKSLVELAVEQAQQAGLEVIVTTDAPNRLRVPICVRRPDHLATDKSRVEDAAIHAVLSMDIEYASALAEREAGVYPRWDTVVLLQPTSPLRDPADILACLDVYEGSPVFTVSEDATERPNGAVYVCSLEHLLEDGAFADPAATMVTMAAERSVDIDTQEDWDLGYERTSYVQPLAFRVDIE